jgi:DNA polymerase V
LGILKSAGIPFSADDRIESRIDLNKLVIQHPAATFFVRVGGHSMKDAGILHNDILVVDRALDVKNNAIIVCIVNRDFAVKRFYKKGENITLYSGHPDYQPIEVTPAMGFQVWGVVSYIIRKTR